jgi:3',5'-cyclic AMP phosphodiesterase CpdA
MKRFQTLAIFELLFTFCFFVFGQSFRFALLTDMHLSPDFPQHTTDLQRAVHEIDSLKQVAFVIVGGDIADKGDRSSLLLAKKLFDELNVPYYVVPGNHDTRYCPTMTTTFDSVFQYHHFTFTYQHVQFIGFNTGQGHGVNSGWVSDPEMSWIEGQLQKTGSQLPLFFVTHFPLNPSDVGNRDAFLQVVKVYNVEAILGGHYHRNVFFDEDGIPDVLTRTLQSNAVVPAGYSLIEVDQAIRFYEKKVGDSHPFLWLTLPFHAQSQKSTSQE